MAFAPFCALSVSSLRCVLVELAQQRVVRRQHFSHVLPIAHKPPEFVVVMHVARTRSQVDLEEATHRITHIGHLLREHITMECQLAQRRNELGAVEGLPSFGA